MATSEKRARTVATIENWMKTMAERLEVKDRRPLVHHLQTHPLFIRRHRGDCELVSTISIRPRARESGETLRMSCGSEFLTHAVTTGEVDSLDATIGVPR